MTASPSTWEFGLTAPCTSSNIKWNPSWGFAFQIRAILPLFARWREEQAPSLRRCREPRALQPVKEGSLINIFTLSVSSHRKGADGVNDQSKRLGERLNDMSTAQEWHAAKPPEYKGHSPVAPGETLWFIYKLLGSVISNSSGVEHWRCMLMLLPT